MQSSQSGAWRAVNTQFQLSCKQISQIHAKLQNHCPLEFINSFKEVFFPDPLRGPKRMESKPQCNPFALKCGSSSFPAPPLGGGLRPWVTFRAGVGLGTGVCLSIPL